MKLTVLDISIIVLYLAATVVIGLVLKKRAEQSKKDYMLGGNRLPWYLLGLSNASGMFDISGTMWLVTLLFVYGLKSAWIPWLWPVFNQIFLMVFLSVWLRRSNVTTGAEWLNTRFSGRGANLSHGVIVVFAIILGLGYLAYGFIGIGKFVEIFVPWETVSAWVPFDIPSEYVAHFYGICITAFAVFYTLLGGMMSIVWADVIQYILMTISGILIGVIAMQAVAEHGVVTPAGWSTPLPEGRARGLALHESFGSIVAMVIEVSARDGRPHAERVVAAVDCGTVVHPDGVAQQLESAVMFGLAAALHGRVDIVGGVVQQKNLPDLPLLTLADTPAIETHVVASEHPPTGMGEPGLPPVAPALANGWFALTGQRLRKLPLGTPA